MKKTLVYGAAAALLAGTAGISFAGTADGQGAQKRALSAVTTDADDQCESSASDDAEVGEQAGFVILNAPGREGAVEKVNGVVSLKDGVPETTYMVFLAVDGQCMPQDMLETNKQGNGNAKIDFPTMGVASEYYVVLQDMTMSERFASEPVVLR